MSYWCYFFPQGFGNTCWWSHSDLHSFRWKANESRHKFFLQCYPYFYPMSIVVGCIFLGTFSFYLNLPLVGKGTGSCLLPFLGSDYFCPFFLLQLVLSEFISVIILFKEQANFLYYMFAFLFYWFLLFYLEFPSVHFI